MVWAGPVRFTGQRASKVGYRIAKLLSVFRIYLFVLGLDSKEKLEDKKGCTIEKN